MRGEIRRGPWPPCGSCSRALVCPTRHDHGDREQSPGTHRTVPQVDTCTATRHDLVRATSPTPGPHRPPSSARSPPVRRRRPLILPAMRTVYSPHYLLSVLKIFNKGRELASANPTTGAQDARVQECGIGPALSVHPRSHLPHLQCPAPPDLRQDAPSIPSRRHSPPLDAPAHPFEKDQRVFKSPPGSRTGSAATPTGAAECVPPIGSF